MTITNELTYPIALRLLTILWIWVESICLVSPIPGVSATITFYSSDLPKKVVAKHSTLLVSDSVEFEVLNFVSPHNPLAREDFPLPVKPIRRAILK